MHQFYFEKLVVWQNARNLCDKIYRLTNSFPEAEKYALTSQLRRSSLSTMTNIAEGSARGTRRDQANFTTIAFSSLMEVLSLLIVSLDQNLISQNNLIELRMDINYIANQLNALRKVQKATFRKSSVLKEC